MRKGQYLVCPLCSIDGRIKTTSHWHGDDYGLCNVDTFLILWSLEIWMNSLLFYLRRLWWYKSYWMWIIYCDIYAKLLKNKPLIRNKYAINTQAVCMLAETSSHCGHCSHSDALNYQLLRLKSCICNWQHLRYITKVIFFLLHGE